MRRAYLPFVAALAGAAVAIEGCGAHRGPERAAYVSLAEVEATYGRLITTGNHPTQQQNGTGERVGLFKDANGTIWGIPLAMGSGGGIFACAPPALLRADVTDTFPAGSTIIGTTNEPTGWRQGTGHLELVMRDARGATRHQVVGGARLAAGPACWAPQFPGPPQRLDYYRLIPSAQ
jgi:hypothetical protein